MREVLSQLEAWWRAGESVGVGTVVQTWNSAPRQAGASMLVGPDGAAVGSVSGGCVESAVYELAAAARDDGSAAVHRFGVADDDAFAVGLTCGGTLDVLVERVSPTSFPEFGRLCEAVRSGRPVAVATLLPRGPGGVRRLMVFGDGRREGGLGVDRLDDAVADDALGLLRQGATAVLTYGPEGQRRGEGTEVFVSSFAPRPHMIVFGAIDFAAAVARIGGFLGYRVTVCDARPTFATAARFPDVDEVVVDWPHRYLADLVDRDEVDERTVLCVLTHDPKFDIPLLEVALRARVGYVGAMGSRVTNDDRLAELRRRGLTDEQLARLHGPIGLDIGARTPEETAVSVAAELIAHRWGGTGGQLRSVQGPIHHPTSV